MSEEFKINPAVYREFLRIKSEKELAAHVHQSLMDEFGASPSPEELRQFFKNENATEIPGFTAEQKAFAMEAMLEFNLGGIQTITDAVLFKQILEMNAPTEPEEFMDQHFPEVE